MRRLLLLLAFAVSCAGVQKDNNTATPRDGTTVSPAHAAYLLVDNQSWSDVRIYVATTNGNMPIRLGIVGSMSKAQLTFRVSVPQSVVFVIVPLASSGFTTDAINVDVGSVLRLNVSEPLRFTTVFAQ